MLHFEVTFYGANSGGECSERSKRLTDDTLSNHIINTLCVIDAPISKYVAVSPKCLT
jgi:hypothetical protein